jgi:hypothetical protein
MTALGADARDRLTVELPPSELHPAGTVQGTNGTIGLKIGIEVAGEGQLLGKEGLQVVDADSWRLRGVRCNRSSASNTGSLLGVGLRSRGQCPAECELRVSPRSSRACSMAMRVAE